MSFQFIKKLPIPQDIKKQYPVPEEIIALKNKRDLEIKEVLTGKSSKFLVIIGPCSADNHDAVLDYMQRLCVVQEKVKDNLILIPRVYTNKPRTTGEGYKGMLHQPDPEKTPDLLNGVISIRKLHLEIMTQTKLMTSDEMLYPENYWYLSDILSYVAVGARSVEDQQHRLTVSGMDIPVGMKNPTSGDYSVMLNSVIAGQSEHTFIYRGWEVNTSGNELTHTVLRGAMNKHGQCIPNYHYEDIIRLVEMYGKRDLKNPAIIVDTNHSNSNKEYKEQIRIAKEVLHSRRYSADINNAVKGLMIESYLEEGAQKIGEGIYGKSITDPCLGWTDSERLIYEIADMI